jgi:lipopolysaccharide biosynthesis glycosyltransferase
MGYQGWAIFADGDMICKDDIAKLWAMRDDKYAVQVVQHDYKTQFPKKYLGNKNENYPKKNWSSLILWNCKHQAHRYLTPDNIAGLAGKFLHRFEWLNDFEIGQLPLTWNWLVMEYPSNESAELLHYTIGTPCFKDYAGCDMNSYWWRYYERSKEGLQEYE